MKPEVWYWVDIAIRIERLEPVYAWRHGFRTYCPRCEWQGEIPQPHECAEWATWRAGVDAAAVPHATRRGCGIVGRLLGR